jgi:predicted choloylglycine hydrolase
MAHSVSALDASGEHAVAFLAPDREAVVMPIAVATNHQHEVEWTNHDERTRSADRERILEERRRDPGTDARTFVQGFLEPPLFSTLFERAFGTLCTACHDPRARRVEYRWPHHRWSQSLDDFVEGELRVDYAHRG